MRNPSRQPPADKTAILCVETALEYWQTAEAPSLEDIRVLFGLLVRRDAFGLIRMTQQAHTASPFPTEAFAGWHGTSGCWTGPVRFDAAGRVAAWLGEHNVGVVIEASGQGDEVRLRYRDRDHGYWWPNTASANGAAEELQRVL